MNVLTPLFPWGSGPLQQATKAKPAIVRGDITLPGTKKRKLPGVVLAAGAAAALWLLSRKK